MPATFAVTYVYDGTFEGFLCCVFESYRAREIPVAIYGPQERVAALFQDRQIATCSELAGRVLQSIPERIGLEALVFLKQAFLTDLIQKECFMLTFLRLGYRYGARVMDMRLDQRLYPLFQAVRRLDRESHLWKGFLRFRETSNDVLVAHFRPKCQVLPMIAEHFCSRYPKERFLILDETHQMALAYQPYEATLVSLEEPFLPAQAVKESETEKLWRLFYETVEIQERRNPRYRMSQMPKWYWENMTEFFTFSGKEKK